MAEKIDAVVNEQVEVKLLADNLPRIVDWLPESRMPFLQLLEDSPLLEALVVALLSVVFALIIRFVVFRALAHLTGTTRVLFDDQLLEHLRKPVYTTVLFFGFTLAVDAAQLAVGPHLLINILLSLIVINWMRALFRISTVLLDT
ncbi:MAG: hypothetical protein KUG67_01745, partial [Proteobacteria bacterium]|nr:hypothetical protein [Pseudomonadota bacterium]